MREFFALTLKSVKLNSPHLSLVAEVKEQELFDQAKNVPFYKWAKWLETTVNAQAVQSQKPAIVQKPVIVSWDLKPQVTVTKA